MRACFLVLVSVAFTLIDVIGYIHYWGLTIDTISCVAVVLVIGLTVDYNSHIAHAYIVSYGSSREEDRDGHIFQK